MSRALGSTTRVGVIVVLVAALLGVVSPAGASLEDESGWIVVMEPGRDVAAEAPGLALAVGGRLGHVYEHLLGGFSFNGPERAATALRRNPNVAAVVRDGTVELAQDVAGHGFFRIDADLSFPTPNAYRGAGVRIAVIDTGIDIDHPDFVANLDLSNAMNCVTPGASVDDDHEHGTHVSGIAAADDNGSGLVGIAPDAEILPLKAFDATGFADDSDILCALDHLAGVMGSDPMPTVVNMSYTDVATPTPCDDIVDELDAKDAVHEAMCDLDAMGVIMVAASGNSYQNTSGRVPAVYDETIAVSGYTDLDGIPGGLGGCSIDWLAFHTDCDDTYLDFSNYGPDIDVTAPGFLVYSTLPGGHGTRSGTSMAAPHVAGVVAIMLSEDPTLTRAEVLSVLLQTGECPDGSVNTDGGTCAGAGTWIDDPDGIPEPLVNALRAAQAVDTGEPPNPPPTAAFTHSCTGLACSFTDTSTDDGTIVGWNWDFGDGNTDTAQNPNHIYAAAGTYTVSLTVTDDDGDTDATTADVTVTSTPTNSPPTADAGPDQTVPDTKKKGTERVDLDGSGSGDSDGSIVSYTWTDAQGSTIATGVSPQVTLTVGTHDITLTVTDDDGDTASDSVTITVGDPPPPPGNETPVADAGGDQTVMDDDGDGSADAVLDGSGSFDPDGSIVSHEWRDEAGGLLGTGVSPTVTLPLGATTVTLTVTDDQGATDTDTVVVTVDLALLWHSHVETLTGSTTSSKGKWDATVEVYVMWRELEDLGSPIGADPSTVTFTTSTGDTLQCTSANSDPTSPDEDGRCSVTLSGLKKNTPSVTFTVTDVWTPGFTYEPDHPHNVTEITVNAP